MFKTIFILLVIFTTDQTQSSRNAFAATKAAGTKETVHVVPLKGQPPLWSREAQLLQYQCKNLKLTARSTISPSTTYPLSDGLFNETDCQKSIASLQEKGCFCDDGTMKCLETEKIEPKGIFCPSDYLCFPLKGEEIGLIKVKTMENHFTRSACEAELKDLVRN